MKQYPADRKTVVFKEVWILRIAFFISVLFVSAFTVFSFYKLKESNNTALWISYTKSLDLELGNIVAAVQQAEIAEKEFLLSQSPNAINKYYRSKEKCLIHLDNTYKIASLIPVDSTELFTLKNLLHQNFAITESYLVKNNKPGEQINQNDSLLLNQIRNEINTIKIVGEDILEDRSKRFEKSSLNNLLLLILLGLLTIILLIVAFVWLNSELKKRLKSGIKVEETSKRLEVLFDQSFQMMILLSKDGKILNLNRPASVFLAMDKNEAIGTPILSLLTKTLDNRAVKQFQDGFAVALSGEFSRREISFSKISSDLDSSLDISFNPILFQNSVDNILIEGRDITEIKQNQQMLVEASQLLNSAESIAQIGSFAYNLNTGAIRWSRGCYRIYNLPEEEPINFQLLEDKLSDEDKVKLRQALKEAVKEEKSFEVTYSILVGKEVKHLLGTGIVQRDGKGIFTGYIGILKDITFEKKSTEKIERTLQELKRSNLELEQFAYIASHDLQEPLRKIQAFGDRLRSKYEGEGSLPGSDYVSRMQDASRRMQTLIDDLLAYSRTGNKTSLAEDVNLNTLIEKILVDLDFIIQEKNATVKFDSLPVISGVKVQLFQLFQNIMHNALKFSSDEKNPFIEINSQIVPSGKVFSHEPLDLSATRYHQISISDNGIGFDESFLPKVFVIFERLHGKSEYPGTGIGMAVCKKIVENHKGIITARSKPGTGTTFYVFLPVHTES